MQDAYKSTGAAGGPPGAPKPAAAAPQAAAAGATAPGAGRPPLVLAQRAQQAQQGGLQLRFRDLSLGRLGPAISGLDWEGLLLDEQASLWKPAEEPVGTLHKRDVARGLHSWQAFASKQSRTAPVLLLVQAGGGAQQLTGTDFPMVQRR